MRDLLSKLRAIENQEESTIPEVGDEIGFSFSPDLEIVSEIIGFTQDGIVVEFDDVGLQHLHENGSLLLDGELSESLDEAKGPCWTGYKRKPGTSSYTQGSCVKESGLMYHAGVKKHGEKYMRLAADAARNGASQEELGKLRDQHSKAYKNKKDEDFDMDEAEYRGKNVPLGKKLPGDVKKSKVYVRKPNGNIVKVNFGDKKMRIKKSNPKRRKSFRARHNCKNPGPRWKARYWSCRSW